MNGHATTLVASVRDNNNEAKGSAHPEVGEFLRRLFRRWLHVFRVAASARFHTLKSLHRQSNLER